MQPGIWRGKDTELVISRKMPVFYGSAIGAGDGEIALHFSTGIVQHIYSTGNRGRTDITSCRGVDYRTCPAINIVCAYGGRGYYFDGRGKCGAGSEDAGSALHIQRIAAYLSVYTGPCCLKRYRVDGASDAGWVVGLLVAASDKGRSDKQGSSQTDKCFFHYFGLCQRN